MKLAKIFPVILAGALVVTSCTTTNVENVKLETKLDSVSYSIGLMNGYNAKRSGLTDLNVKAMDKGFVEYIEDEENTIISIQEADQIIRSYQMEQQKIVGEKNLEEGKKFLEENASKEGVITTESGLQYMVMEEGNGPKPVAEDMVRVHYKGTLLNGEVFDSSYERDQPAEFPLNRVIPGWTEGVQLMSVGSKYKFFIPSELAYGPQQRSELITPNSTLIFEVELLDILTEEEGN